ncbi:AtpZ/AtpI family protein [Patescibacteria group bacterium]|nr:AtpZ/AtpI family protein [Patescibacteria group bacterium]
MESQNKQSNNPWLSAAVLFLVKVSSYIAVSAVIGVLGGKWLDTYLGTRPFGMIVLTMLGFGVSIMGILREIKLYNKSL